MYKKEQFRTAAAIMTLAVFLAGCSAPSIPGIENATDGSENQAETEETEVNQEPAGEDQEAAGDSEETSAAEETGEDQKTPEGAKKEEEEKQEEEEKKEEPEKEEEKVPEKEEEEGDPEEAMIPIAESAVYAYYFNEKYVDSLTASDATLFDTAMTAYAAEAISLGTAKRTMHGGKMTAAISAADLKNAAFAIFPDFTEDILKAYDPAEYFHGDKEKDNYFITPAPDDTYALVTGTEKDRKGGLLFEVTVMNAKGEELAGYQLTMDRYTGKETTYAYRSSAVESVWQEDGDGYAVDTKELIPLLESLARDSFTDKWDKEGQDAACRSLLEWAFKNVKENRDKDVRSAISGAAGDLLKTMDEKELVRFLAVWPAVSQGMDNLLASDDIYSLLEEWKEGTEAPVIEEALARWEILGSSIYDSIRQVGYDTLKKTKKAQ